MSQNYPKTDTQTNEKESSRESFYVNGQVVCQVVCLSHLLVLTLRRALTREGEHLFWEVSLLEKLNVGKNRRLLLVNLSTRKAMLLWDPADTEPLRNGPAFSQALI